MKKVTKGPTALVHDFVLGVLGASHTRVGSRLFDYWSRGDILSFLDTVSSVSVSTLEQSAEPSLDYLLSELVSKSDFLRIPGLNRKQAALEKFFEAEESCRNTNNLLWKDRPVLHVGLGSADVILLWRRKIDRILGSFSWDDAATSFGFGPGANVGILRRDATRPNKMGCLRPTVTPGCLAVAEAALRHFDLWGSFLRQGGGRFDLVPGNKIVTVPKNWKTDRTIAIEPLMNSFIQKGIGQLIRKRLAVNGCDLSDQTVNQRLALEGSVSRRLATIDLSMASDTVSQNLVDQLLPPDWAEPLLMARSPRGVLPSGEILLYQKWSSMGNAYTFELESLLFFSLAQVVRDLVGDQDDVIGVYGDDLVVPCSWAAALMECLRVFGFSPNHKKSHFSSESGFRESCGKHFLNGVDITPFYIRKDIPSPERVIWLANAVKRWSSRQFGEGLLACDSTLQPCYSQLVSALPTRYQKPSIPDGFGDGALVGDWDEVCPSRPSARSKRAGWDGWVTSHHIRVYYERECGGVPRLMSNLFDAERKGERTAEPASLQAYAKSHEATNVFPESIRGGYRWLKRPLFVPKQWRDLGPWVADL